MTGLVEQEPYLKIKKLFNEKKFDDIIDYCQKLLVKDPKNKLALHNISTAYNMVSGYPVSYTHLTLPTKRIV